MGMRNTKTCLCRNSDIKVRMGGEDAYLSKRAQTGKNGSADPGAVFPLRGGVDFDLHLLYREAADLGEKAVTEAYVWSVD